MPPARRFLKTNKGTETPSNHLFFDSETYAPEFTAAGGQKALRLRLWSAIALRLDGDKVSRRVECRGTTVEEFWAFARSRTNPQNPLWMWCHNAACDWTWLNFWGELLSRRLTLGPVPRPPSPTTGKARAPWKGRLVLESRPAFAVVRSGAATMKLVDTGNFWPEKLASIGEKRGVPKLPWPGFEANDETMFTYCLNDCKVIEVAVLDLLRWWKKENCGVFQMSAPAMSLQNFRHTAPCVSADGSKVDILCEPNHPTHKLERRGYYGPRFEAFYEGKIHEPCYQYDRNSCYLADMEIGLFPRMRVGTPQNMTADELRRQMVTYGAVAEVEISDRIETYPWRPKNRPLQLHVCGHFWTVLCGPELLRALDSGSVRSVGKVVLYSMAKLFRGWADRWHRVKMEARRNGDAGREEFAKLIGTSLSGKWGQHGTGWRDRLDLGFEPFNRKWAAWDRDSNSYKTFRGVAGIIQEHVEGDEPGHCSPIISAYISAYSREHMRWVIGKLPPKSVFYVGSDSLIVNERGREELILNGLVDEEEMGQFKLKWEGDDGEIIGTNCYRVGKHEVRSGLHGKPHLNDQGKKVATRWEKMPGLVSRPFDGTVRYEEHDWVDPDPRRKGKLQPDGWLLPYWVSLTSSESDFPEEEHVPDSAQPAEETDTNTKRPHPIKRRRLSLGAP